MGRISATGSGKATVSTAAALDAVLQAKEKMGNSRFNLSIVYSSSEYNHKEVVDAVRKATNNALLIGASSSGEFTEKIVENGSVAVGKLTTPDEIAQYFTNYMLGLKTEKEGEYKARWPSSINEDYSLNFACAIAEGAVFRIMDCSNLDDQVNAAEEAAKMARRSAENAGYSEFAGILVFDCAHRQLILGDRFLEAVDRFKKVLPGVPMLGWETYGEIRMEPGQFSGFHNSTSVVLLLPKGDRK